MEMRKFKKMQHGVNLLAVDGISSRDGLVKDPDPGPDDPVATEAATDDSSLW